MYYKLNMKLTSEQIDQIKKACEDVEFGSITIKMNATAKFIDLVVEKQNFFHGRVRCRCDALPQRRNGSRKGLYFLHLKLRLYGKRLISDR